MLTLVLIAAGGLYRARVASVHSAEASRLGAVSVAVGLAYALFAPSTAGSGAGAATAAGVLFLALLSGRSVYRNWLLAQRATGKRLRAVVMIGADDEAYRMADHLAERPQIGYQVVGYLRSAGAPEQGRRPVLVAKLRHDPPADWNNHRHDLANLTGYVEKLWQRDLTWQIVNSAAATVESRTVRFIVRMNRVSVSFATPNRHPETLGTDRGLFACDGLRHSGGIPPEARRIVHLAAMAASASDSSETSNNLGGKPPKRRPRG